MEREGRMTDAVRASFWPPRFLAWFDVALARGACCPGCHRHNRGVTQLSDVTAV
jgi:hypothetical protein